jgi:hypothetical protein
VKRIAAPKLAADVRSARRHRLAIAALVGLHFAVLLTAPICTDQAGLLPHSYPLVRINRIPLAWLVGATMVIAWGVAYFPGRRMLPISLGLMVWLWLAMALLLGQSMTPNPVYEVDRWLAGTFALGAVAILLFVVQRRLWRYCLTVDGQPVDESRRPFRFPLRGLMAATALIGLTLALARLLHPRKLYMFEFLLFPGYVSSLIRDNAVTLVLMGLFCLLATWLASRSARGALWLLLLVTPLFVAIHALLLLLEWLYERWNAAWLPRALPGIVLTAYRHILWEISAEHFAIAACLALSFAVLRRAGLRAEPPGKDSNDRAHVSDASRLPGTPLSGGC